MRKTPASALSPGIPQQGQMASADLLPGVSGPVPLRRKRWQPDDSSICPLLLVTLQRRKSNLCPACVGSMNGLAVVTKRLLGEPFRIAALLCALRPRVAIGMKRNALDAKSLAALFEFRGAVATADGLEIGEQRAFCRQTTQDGFDVGAKMNHRETAGLLAGVSDSLV